MAPRNQDHVVEAEPTQTSEPGAGDLQRALEVTRIVRAVGACDGVLELGHDVGGDRALAAKVAEPRDSLAERPPAAPGARPDPAVELPGRPLDPAGARPRADQHGRAAEGLGPDRRERGSIDALARPEPAHDPQGLVEAPEARGEVEAERREVGGRRAGSDAEPQPAAGHEVCGQHPLGKLHRVSQGDLEDPGPQLDVARHGGRDGESGEGVGLKESAADRVESPRALEADGLDAPGGVGQRRGRERAPGGQGDPEARHRSYLGLNPDVPTQPVSETSSMTPSGPLYLTSTLPS